MNIPYNKIVEMVSEQAGVSAEDVEKKVDEKLKSLSGLITKEGAAHIVANELKVKLFESGTIKYKVKDIAAGLRGIEIVAKVMNIFEVREFQVASRSGKVGNMIIADETGSMRVAMWGNATEKLKEMNVGDVVKISSGYSRMNNNNVELHANESSEIIINPEGEVIEEVKTSVNVERKSIKDLTEGIKSEIMGVVVQMFEPRFYEVCPECGKRIKELNEEFNCDAHGKVEPAFGYVLNFVLDDGTENIRIVCFRDKAESALKVDSAGILKMKDDINVFDEAKNKVLGTQIVVKGRVVKNAMFDRLEVMCDEVSKPDADEELKRVNEGQNAS